MQENTIRRFVLRRRSNLDEENGKRNMETDLHDMEKSIKERECFWFGWQESGESLNYISCNVIVCLVATGKEEEGPRNLHLYKLLPKKKLKKKLKLREFLWLFEIIFKKYIYYTFFLLFVGIIIIHQSYRKSSLCVTF